MSAKHIRFAVVLCLVTVLVATGAHAEGNPGRAGNAAAPAATLLVSGMQSGSGSTVGPDRALYVTDGAAGKVLRIDPHTGAVSTYASGLPKSIIGIGGAIDVAFIGNTGYVLVTLVGEDVGGSDIVGLYRIDGPNQFSVIADIGAFAQAHPPQTDYAVPTGLQYALEKYQAGFLVTDGHHNRVLRVALDGTISEAIAFDNIVPTGLALSGNRVYMAEAGPVPHKSETGKIVTFTATSLAAVDVAAGAPLLVDVEFGRGHNLYALSQGEFPEDQELPPGSPAEANTGSLLLVTDDGTFDVVVTGLNQPTSLEFIGNTAYIVTLNGEIWKSEAPPAQWHGTGPGL